MNRIILQILLLVIFYIKFSIFKIIISVVLSDFSHYPARISLINLSFPAVSPGSILLYLKILYLFSNRSSLSPSIHALYGRLASILSFWFILHLILLHQEFFAILTINIPRLTSTSATKYFKVIVCHSDRNIAERIAPKIGFVKPYMVTDDTGLYLSSTPQME